MKSLAYYIDPLLDRQGEIFPESWLNALADLADCLPDRRHIVISAQEVQMEGGGRLEFHKLDPPKKSWFNRSGLQPALISFCRQEKISLWITFDPESVLPAEHTQTVLVSDAASLLENKERKSWISGKKPAPAWTNARSIILPSNTDKATILASNSQLEDRIRVIYPAFQDPVAETSWSDKEHLKLRYSGGRDFLLFAGSISEAHGLIHLLKGYSLFKKWLMTGMPLILAGPATAYTPTLEKLLTTYKYRSDVSVYPDLKESELKELVAASYALVWPADEGAVGFGSAGVEEAYPLEWAMSAGVPVIGTELPITKEYWGDAALLTPAGDIDQMAHSLMLLYKDENLRNNLISNGKIRSEQLNRSNTIKQYADLLRGLSAF